ncbi:MAG: hypothetical protein J7L15_00445 [Clostridiales bacterium]|nr:hypothetical protein [Clostridiales bacterium]
MEQKELEYIKLASAHATQHSKDGVKGDWSIEENITNDRLFTLPKHLSDTAVFSILNSARKYELEAWNSGITFQKNINNDFLSSKIKNLQKINLALIEENERLSDVLDHLTKG